MALATALAHVAVAEQLSKKQGDVAAAVSMLEVAGELLRRHRGTPQLQVGGGGRAGGQCGVCMCERRVCTSALCAMHACAFKAAEAGHAAARPQTSCTSLYAVRCGC